MAELSTIARPYAEALFAVAKTGDMATVSRELSVLASVADHPGIQEWVKNPNVSRSATLEMLTAAVKTPLSTTSSNFLAAVVQNGRTELLQEIAHQFAVLKNASEGASDAHITSAFELSAVQLSDLTAALQRKFGLQLKPTVSVDAALIGGVRVNVGDQVLDTSVQAQLERMRVALMA
jgi:F-type H+-transporting ATPase subunit delta